MYFLGAVPAREGHFRLESGYHTHLWLTLDGLFASPRERAPAIEALAARLRRHDVSAICGPLLGGAFLAQALAMALDVDFLFTEPAPREGSQRLFSARYRLPPVFQPRVRGRRIAVVDDVISAGSSVRATAEALEASGGVMAVVATLLTLGSLGVDHFTSRGIEVEALDRRDFTMWKPEECPLCAEGRPLEDPSDTGHR